MDNATHKLVEVLQALPARIAAELEKRECAKPRVDPILWLILERISHQEQRIMSKITLLAAAIAALGVQNQAVIDGITNLTNVVQTEDTAIQNAIAALGDVSDPAVQALIDAVTAQQTNLTGAVQSLATVATDAAQQTGNLNTALNQGGGAAQLSITGFAPSAGTEGDGITLTGTGFDASTTVAFGGAAAPVASASSDGTSATCAVPADAVSGPITVANATATATSTDAFSVS